MFSYLVLYLFICLLHVSFFEWLRRMVSLYRKITRKFLKITAYDGNIVELVLVGPSSRRGRNGTVLHGAEGIVSTVVSFISPKSRKMSFYVNPG